MSESGAREVRVLAPARAQRHGKRKLPDCAGSEVRRAEPRVLEPQRPPVEARASRPSFHAAALLEARSTAPAPRLFTLGTLIALGSEKHSLLERISVGASTQQHYAQRIEDFHSFVEMNGMQLTSPAEVEEAIVSCMNEMFLDGLPAHKGEKLWAALQWRHPEIGRRGSVTLPRVAQALQGWRKGAPSAQRLPMAWVEACGMAAHMADRGSLVEGIMLLVMFDLYLRPSEAHGLRVADAAPPVTMAPALAAHWSFTIRPWEKGLPSKTGAYDDTVVMDRSDRQFLTNYLTLLRQDKPASAKLFTNVSIESFNRAFRAAAATLALDLVPYQARHGGATHDRWDQSRSLEEVRKRGRWRSEQSTRRYEKHGKLQGRLGAMAPATLSHLVWCTKNFDALLSGTMRVSHSPTPAAAG